MWGLLRDVGLETADYTLDSSWLVLYMQLSEVWKSGLRSNVKERETSIFIYHNKQCKLLRHGCLKVVKHTHI